MNSLLTAILAIAGLIIIIAACAFLGWNYLDYIINAWNWVTEAYNALIETVPGWAFVIVGATLVLAFLGILVRLL